MIGSWMLILMFLLLVGMAIGACYDIRAQNIRHSNYYREYINELLSRNPNLTVNGDPNRRQRNDNGVELPVQRSGESVPVGPERAREGCSICLEALGKDGDDEDVASLSCDHLFHLHCIVEWTTKAKWCPLCRRIVDRVVVSKMKKEDSLGTSHDDRVSDIETQ